MERLDLYTFDSIRDYHYSFMTVRILHGQDDPVAWATEDTRCEVLLIRKDSLFEEQGDHDDQTEEELQLRHGE